MLAILISGCRSSQPGPRIRVACSIFPLADIARNVGKEWVDVHVLIPPGASPHTFEPSPQEFKNFTNVRVFVMVGAGFEFWAEKLVTGSSGESLLVVRASEGVELTSGLASGDHRPNPTSPRAQEGNPHIWLDPAIARKITYRIAGALARADPDHAPSYLDNANEYACLLDSLDVEIREAIKGFKTKEYVALHPAWHYFSEAYGLREIGVIEESPGRGPTPKQLKRIVADIAKFKIKAVFAEPQLSAKAARAIAEEANVRVLILDPLGGEGIPGRDSYLGLMRYNLGVMREAME